MSERKSQQSLVNLERALHRLEEALEQPMDNSLYTDGVIQRFEFTVELFWKTLKRMLQDEGVAAHTPREAFQQAYAARWLDEDETWLHMLRDRNESSHVYDEKAALRILQHIREYAPVMRRTFSFLEARSRQA